MFVSIYGGWIFVQALGPWLTIRTPGTTIGPPAYVQWWNAQFADGLVLIGFGAVLMVGSFLLFRVGAGGAARRGSTTAPSHIVFVLLAVGLIALGAVAVSLPAPQRSVSFSTSDFVLRGLPGNPPYDYYFVSVPFEAHAGEVLVPMVNLTVTDNRTGALESWNPFASTWYTPPSEVLDWRDASTWAWETVVPHDGLYVAWVRYDGCASPTTSPCENYTASVRGELLILDPLAYGPWFLGFGLFGCVAMGAAVSQSGLGRRRMTSW